MFRVVPGSNKERVKAPNVAEAAGGPWCLRAGGHTSISVCCDEAAVEQEMAKTGVLSAVLLVRATPAPWLSSGSDVPRLGAAASEVLPTTFAMFLHLKRCESLGGVQSHGMFEGPDSVWKAAEGLAAEEAERHDVEGMSLLSERRKRGHHSPSRVAMATAIKIRSVETFGGDSSHHLGMLS